ncbi:MAG: ABC transporter substrate-binding protein [Desulfobulbus sp.]
MRLKLLPFAVLVTVGTVQLFCAGDAVGAGRLATILQSNTLRVCIWPDYYGISYRNPKNNQLSGIDVDMARELAHDLGPSVQVRFVDSSFAHLIDDLTEDRCDIAMFAIGITTARQEKLCFTKPHLQSDVFAITTRSNRRVRQWADIDQPGRVVAVAKGTLHEPLMQEKLRYAELAVLDTPFAREQEVESGRADVFMTDYPYSQRMLANSDWARLIAPPTTYHITPYAYAMAQGDDRWQDRVEQFVASTKKDGRLLAISKRYHLEAMARLD